MRWIIAGLTASLTILISAQTASAQWPEYGVHVSHPDVPASTIDAIPDGAGGVFLTYQGHDTADMNIYAQRLDAWGRALWRSGGVAVCVADNAQSQPRLTADGSGGVFITWQDSRDGNIDIYAQRIDGAGVPQWTVDGAAVCTADNHQQRPRLVADGAGGVILAWMDARISGNTDIYAQRLDHTGHALWYSNGVGVCLESGGQYTPILVTDEAGGAICVWEDHRVGSYAHIYAQRILPDGTTDWTEGGVVVSDATNYQILPQAVSDQAGGAIVTWHESDTLDEFDIYAQRITGGGWPSWTADGLPVCSAAASQTEPHLISSESYGAIIAWEDCRSDGFGDVYIQKMDGDGNMLWQADGVAVCTAQRNQQDVRIATNDVGGAIVTWLDSRIVTYEKIFTQMIDADGAPQWGPDGMECFSPLLKQDGPCIVADGAGGALVAGECKIDDDDHLYAQRIERNGLWGYPSPWIAGADDVPGDQGGYVELAFDASRLDPWPAEEISHYSIWRAISGSAPAPRDQSAEWLAATLNGEGPVYRMSESGGRAYYWELVETMDAYHLPAYSSAVPTLFDSTEVNQDYHYFQVIAHANDPSQYWMSPPDSARSVDNLAPGAPAALAGEHGDGENLVYWLPSGIHDEDLDHYRIYAAYESGFPSSPEYLIGLTPDTLFVDPEADETKYYRVSGVDIHGNEGETTQELELVVVSAASDMEPISTLRFGMDRNPSGTRSVFHLDLPQAADVSLMVYSPGGRCVGELHEGRLETGYHTFSWDTGNQHGGVFFARLRAGAEERIVRLVAIR